jgi:xylulokinase
VVAEAAASYPIAYPRAGWAEQDPQAWLSALESVVPRLVAEGGIDRRSVVAIGLATQVDGLVAVDASLRPLAPAMIWIDRRATRQTARLRDSLGEAAILRTTGLNIDACHVAPKILWFREERPEFLDRTRAYLLPGSFLVAQMTGEMVVDHANASSTMLYDIEARAWSPTLLERCELDVSLLAAIRSARDPAGNLRPPVAERLGLDPSCVVVVGTGDEHGACLGAGAIREDVICDITGTAEPVACASGRAIFDPTGLVETHAHADDRLWLIENPGFVSGGTVRWLLDLVGWDEAALSAAADVPAGSDGLTFLPTLGGSTTPRWNDRARGVVAGLALNHGRAHVARALLEGCAFALRDLVDRLDDLGLGGPEIRVVGGGARSELWLQIKADVTGRTVRTVAAEEVTALGASLLAGVEAGFFADLTEAVDRLAVLDDRGYAPDPSTRDAYADAYGRYRRLYDATDRLLEPEATP